MTVDAAAGRAAARVLHRAYARTVRKLRKDNDLDVVAGLRRRDNRATVAAVTESMTAGLMGYGIVAVLAATPVLVVVTRIEPRVVRFVVLAVTLVPAAVPVAGVALLQYWAVAYAWRARRAEHPARLGPADVDAVLARGGIAVWRLAVVFGVVAAFALSAVPPP